MIVGIGGTPGSGKSYYVLTLIMSLLMRGRVVFTNILSLDIHSIAKEVVRLKHGRKVFIKRPDFALEQARKVYHQVMFIRADEATDLVTQRGRFEGVYPSHLRGCVVVLDEVMMAWLSRDYKSFSKELVFFFSQHRKYGLDVYYIAQDLSKVDSVIRAMTERSFVCSNVRNRRLILGLSLPLDVFFVRELHHDGTHAKSHVVFPRLKYYGFYNTAALFFGAMVKIADPLEPYYDGQVPEHPRGLTYSAWDPLRSSKFFRGRVIYDRKLSASA